MDNPSHQLQPNQLGVVTRKILLYKREDSYIQTLEIYMKTLKIKYMQAKIPCFMYVNILFGYFWW